MVYKMKILIIVSFALTSICYGQAQTKSVYMKTGPTGTIDTTSSRGVTTLYQNSLKLNSSALAPAVSAKQDSMNIYMPETYGAVGDGVTDDAPAFNAMMTAMPARGMIHLSTKNYKLNSTWFVTKTVKIQGSGFGSIFSCGVNNIDMIKVSADYVVMRDFFMYNTFTPTSGCAIKIDSSVAHPAQVAKFTMDNITINQFFTCVDARNALGWTMTNCGINYVNTGVYVNCAITDAGDSHITGCTFQPRAGFTGVYAIYQAGSGGLRIVNNKFNGNSVQTYNYAYYGTTLVNTVDLIIVGNSFENYNQSAIKLLSSYVTSWAFHNIAITGNQFGSYQTGNKPDIVLDSIYTATIHANVFSYSGGGNDTAIKITNCSDVSVNNLYYNYTRPVHYVGSNTRLKGDGASQGTSSDKGTATLVGGTVTVSNSYVKTGAVITVTVKTPGGTQGFLSVPTITNNSSFVINSSSASETSTVNWSIEN